MRIFLEYLKVSLWMLPSILPEVWLQAKFNPVQAPPKAEGTAAAAQKQTQPQAEPLQPLQIGFALWLAGVLFFALRTAVSVFRMKALLRRCEK